MRGEDTRGEETRVEETGADETRWKETRRGDLSISFCLQCKNPTL